MGVCMSTDDDNGLEDLVSEGEDDMDQAKKEMRRKKKKMLMEMLNAEAEVHQFLRRMPGRTIKNGSMGSASLFSKQGRKGVNQDCMLVWEGFGSQESTVFCGIFDGHGPCGHVVARKVRDNLPILLALPLRLLSDAESQVSSDDIDNLKCHECSKEYDDDEKNTMDPNNLKCHECSNKESGNESGSAANWKEKLVTAYKLMDRNLKFHPKVNCFCSGTTALSLIIQGDNLVIGNVGDSRAILATRSPNGSLVANQLTRDLKPNLPGELERIRRCKGRVFALRDEPHVARVWMPHIDAPGLAMARSLGDFCLKDYGVSAIPEVSYQKLTKQDEFIVLASDGIWDVLSNNEVVSIVASTFPKEAAAKALVRAATHAWRKAHSAWRTDDCTVICLFLKERLNSIGEYKRTCKL